MRHSLFVTLVVVFTRLAFGQFTGGTQGPCSAITIPGPFGVAVNVFGNTGLPNISNSSNSICTSSLSPAIWYTIQADNGNPITVSTCTPDTNFDTIISIYTGNCEQLSCLAYNDDNSECIHPRSSQLTFTPLASNFYFISVGGFGEGTGIFQLAVSEIGTSTSGSSCSSAISISSPVEIYNSNYLGAGYASDCTFSNNKYIWYVLDNVQTGIPLRVTTCSSETNFDTVIAIYTSCPNTTCAAYNDDSSCFYSEIYSEITFTPLSTSPLYIAVGGFSGHFGDYLLNVSQSGVSISAACSASEPAYLGSSVFGYNYDAPPIDFDPCAHVTDFPTSWFYFTANFTGNYVASTCNPFTNFHTQIFVYSGRCSALSCIQTSAVSYCLDYSNLEIIDFVETNDLAVSATPTASSTPTPTSTRTSSPTKSLTPTSSPTPTRTATRSPTSTITRTPSPSRSAVSPSLSSSPSVYPSNTANYGNAVTFMAYEQVEYYFAVTGTSTFETGSFYLYLAPY